MTPKFKRTLQLKRETLMNLTPDEMTGIVAGTGPTITLVTQFTYQAQQFLKNANGRPGVLDSAKNWWNHGGKDFVNRALHTEHCPLSGGTATGNC